MTGFRVSPFCSILNLPTHIRNNWCIISLFTSVSFSRFLLCTQPLITVISRRIGRKTRFVMHSMSSFLANFFRFLISYFSVYLIHKKSIDIMSISTYLCLSLVLRSRFTFEVWMCWVTLVEIDDPSVNIDFRKATHARSDCAWKVTAPGHLRLRIHHSRQYLQHRYLHNR